MNIRLELSVSVPWDGSPPKGRGTDWMHYSIPPSSSSG